MTSADIVFAKVAEGRKLLGFKDFLWMLQLASEEKGRATRSSANARRHARPGRARHQGGVHQAARRQGHVHGRVRRQPRHRRARPRAQVVERGTDEAAERGRDGGHLRRLCTVHGGKPGSRWTWSSGESCARTAGSSNRTRADASPRIRRTPSSARCARRRATPWATSTSGGCWTSAPRPRGVLREAVQAVLQAEDPDENTCAYYVITALTLAVN